MNKNTANEKADLGEELWNYACDLYSNKHVENKCLELQNSFRADVNMLLFICWLVEKGYSLNDDEHLKILNEVSTIWQRDVVEPLRQLRKQISEMSGLDAKQVKASLLKSELEAEKSELYALSDLVELLPKEDKAKSKYEMAVEHLNRYMELLDSFKTKANYQNLLEDIAKTAFSE